MYSLIELVSFLNKILCIYNKFLKGQRIRRKNISERDWNGLLFDQLSNYIVNNKRNDKNKQNFCLGVIS